MADFGYYFFDINNEQNIGSNEMMASRFYCPRSGTANFVIMTSVVPNFAGGHMQGMIYTDHSGAPGTLVGATQVAAAPDLSGVSVTLACSIFIPSAGYYWLAVGTDFVGFLFGNQYIKLKTPSNVVRGGYTVGNPPSNFGVSTAGVNQLMTFVNFTPNLAAGSYLGEITGGLQQPGGANEYPANTITVFKVTAPHPGVLTQFFVYLKDNYAGAKLKCLVFDSTGAGGSPGNLLGSTPELTGPTVSENLLTPASPIAIPAGVVYIGLMNDTLMQEFNLISTGSGNLQVSYTYTSGPPATFPGMSLAYGYAPTFWATYVPAMQSNMLEQDVFTGPIECGPAIPIFPTLPVGFPLSILPTFKTTIGANVSDREMRVANQSQALWEITLTFEELRDQTQNQTAFAQLAGFTQFEQLCQIFLMMYGKGNIFAFDAPWDDSRQDQAIATGDGSTYLFTIVRSFGHGTAFLVEPIGMINSVTNVKVAGSVVSPSNYFVAGNRLYFIDSTGGTHPPALGASITMTFSFYYLCRFTEDNQLFEEFFKNRWEVKQLKFRSINWVWG